MNELARDIALSRDKGLVPAFSYERVSTDEQAEHGMSLDNQVQYARQYAEKNNLQIIKFFTVAESAYKEGRQRFNEMIASALEYGISDIIFKNSDRLGRNDIDWPRLKKLAKEKKIKLHFYEFSIVFDHGATAESEMFLDQASALARYWSNKISYSVRKSYDFKISQGIAPQACRTIGYIYDRANKRFLIDEKTKGIVEYIFNEWDSGTHSLRDFCVMLNARGYRTLRGSHWKKSSIHRMLTNPFYAGKFIYHGQIYDGIHESYISWEKFQIRLQKLGVKNVSKKGRPFLFKGLLKLSGSGRVLSGAYKQGAHNSGEYIYYTSYEPYFSIREDQVFEMLDQAIKEISFNDNFEQNLIDLFTERAKNKSDKRDGEIKFIRRRIGKLESENKRLLELAIAGIDPKTIQDKMQENRGMINVLEKQTHGINMDWHNFSMDIASKIESCREFPEIYLQVDREDKADLIKTIASKLIVHQDKIEIVFLKPFEFIFNPEILKHKSGFQNRHVMGPQRDNLRTAVDHQIERWVQWLAA